MGKSREGGKDHRRTSSKAPRRTARGLEHLGEAINASLGVDPEENSEGNDAVKEVIIPQEDPAPDQGEPGTHADSEDMQATDAVNSNGFFSYVPDFNTLLQGVYNSRAIATDKDSKISGKILAEQIDKVRRGKLALDKLPDIGGLHAKVKELLEKTPASERQVPFVPKVIQPETLSSSQGSSYTRDMAEAHSGKEKVIIKKQVNHQHFYGGAMPHAANGMHAGNGPVGGSPDSPVVRSKEAQESHEQLLKAIEKLTERVDALSNKTPEKAVATEPPPDLPNPPRSNESTPATAAGNQSQAGPLYDYPRHPRAEYGLRNDRTAKNVKEFKGSEIDTLLSEDDKVILRKILTNRGPEAMQKAQDLFHHRPGPDGKFDGTRLAQTSMKEQERAMPHAVKMYDAEGRYLRALRDFHKGRSGLSVRIGDKLSYTEASLPQEVKDLKQTYDQARAEYAGYLKGSAENRLREDKRGKNRSEEQKAKILERYNRIITAREVVLGANEAEKRAKEEGLNRREKDFVDRRLDWFKNKVSPSTKLLLGAAVMGGLGTAAVAGGSAVGLLGTVMAVPSAVYALRAMLTKDQAKKDLFNKRAAGFAKWTIGGLFGRLGAAATRKTHDVLKTEDKAKKELSNRKGFGDLSDISNLASVSDRRSRALNAKEKMQKDEQYVRFGSAFVGGALAGGLVSAAVPEAGAVVSGIPGHVEAFAGHAGSSLGLDHVHPGGGLEHPGADTYHLSIGQTADGVPINDADKLLGHFANQLHTNHIHDHEPIPPAVQKFYSLLEKKGHPGFLWKSSENSAAIKLGLETKDGSALMQPGDTISYNNGDIILVHPGHPPHTLIDSTGKLHPLTSKDWPLKLNHGVERHVTTHKEAVKDAGEHVENQVAKPGEAAPITESTPPHVPTHPPTVGHAPAPVAASTDHTEAGLNKHIHETDLKQIVENQKVQNDYNALASEYARARALHDAGLHTQADRDAYTFAYKTYVDHYNAYIKEHPSSVASHSPESSTATKPTASAEVSAIHGQNLEALHSSIADLKNMSGWAVLHNADAYEIFSTPPDPSEIAQVAFRNKLLEIVRETGVQPTAVSVSDYIDKINK